jgi:two-component system, cell cycle response regulator CtrA
VTVLVVEDDPDQLAIRTMLLESQGYRVHAAANAEEASNRAALDAIDCAVVDLRLPNECDGMQLLAQLRKDHPETYLIVLTGSSLPHGTPHHLALRKGVGVQQLLQALQDVACR